MEDTLSKGRSLAQGTKKFVSRFRLELLREPSAEELPSGKLSVEQAAQLAHGSLRGLDREALGALYLNPAERLLGICVAYVGTITRLCVEPRGLLVPALLSNASRLIAFHNHPSGCLTPSADDAGFTRQLAEAADLLGLELADHLILGDEPAYLSMRERGFL